MPPSSRQWGPPLPLATEDTLRAIERKIPALSGGSMPVVGPVTDAELRASPIDVITPDFSMTAFGWLRSAAPVGIFESTMQYDLEPYQWETSLSGTGSVTHRPLKSTCELSTGGTASGAKVIRQSKPYVRYQPGKGQLIVMSFVLGAAATNVRRRVGYFDADGGVFLEQTSTGLRFVRRTKVSGVVVDNAVESASWTSGTVPDPTKSILMFIQFEWLGVGRVQCGFAHPVTGELTTAHTFLNANVLSTVWTTTGSLPCRYELENTGTASGTSTMDQICSAVISEGGFESPNGYGSSASNGVTSIAVTARRPILSIRHALTFPTAGTIVNRVPITEVGVELLATTNNGFWEIVVGGTLTGAAFADVAPVASCMQKDVTANAISGGIVVDSGFVLAGTGVTANRIVQDVARKIPLALDINGANPVNLSVVVTPFTGTCNAAATLRWKELR